MTSIINKIFLKRVLQNVKSIDQVEKFCKSRKKICEENKSEVCRQILLLSKYNVLDQTTNFCEIYRELANLTRNLPRSDISKHSYIEMTPALYEECIQYGSTKLHEFLYKNGYDVLKDVKKYKPKRLIDIKTATRMEDLPTKIIK